MSRRSVRLENNMSQALVSPSSEPSVQSQKSSFNFEESNEIFTGGWNPNALHSCLGLPLADAQKLVSVICVLSVHVYAHRCSIFMVHACLCWVCFCVYISSRAYVCDCVFVFPYVFVSISRLSLCLSRHVFPSCQVSMSLSVSINRAKRYMQQCECVYQNIFFWQIALQIYRPV